MVWQSREKAEFSLRNYFLFVGLIGAFVSVASGATTGSISGTISDATGAVIPGVAVTATNTAQGLQTKTMTDAKGFYMFPRLAVGAYEVQVKGEGFAPQKKSDLAVDTDSAVRADFTLQVIERAEEI